MIRRHALSTLLATLMLTGSLVAAAKSPGPAAPHIRLASSGKHTARLTLDNAYFPSSRRGAVQLSMTLPAAVAARFAGAAKKGGVRVFTTKDMTGPQVRLIAGKGADTVIIDRTKRGDKNGQSGSGDLRVQLGVGKGSRAFFVGKTSRLSLLGDTLITGGSSRTVRSGVSSTINPTTLAPVTPQAEQKFNWWLKPTSKRTTNLGAGLIAYSGYGEPAARVLVNVEARLTLGKLTGGDSAQLNSNLDAIASSINAHKRSTRRGRRGPNPAQTKAALHQAAKGELFAARRAMHKQDYYEVAATTAKLLFTKNGTLRQRIDPVQAKEAREAMRASYVAWSDALIGQLRADLAALKRAYTKVPKGKRFDPKVLDGMTWHYYPRWGVEGRWGRPLTTEQQQLLKYVDSQLVKVSHGTVYADLLRAAVSYSVPYSNWEPMKAEIRKMLPADQGKRERQIAQLRKAIETERGRAELRLARNVFGLKKKPSSWGYPNNMIYGLTAPVLEYD